MIIRGETILAAGALLPLAETTVHTERFGTRHRAALGIAEQTDAVVIVVSEENGQISLVSVPGSCATSTRRSSPASIRHLLDPNHGRRRGALGWRPPRRDDRALGRTGSAVTRVLRVLVHNWPLKLAALGLATLLYGGLVFSQSSQPFDGVVPVEVRGQAPGTFLLTQPDPVTTIRYLAPSGIRPITSTFEAPDRPDGLRGGCWPTSLPVHVRSIDARISVIGSNRIASPSISTSAPSASVPVVVPKVAPPENMELGPTTVSPESVTISGPASVLARVVEARANVLIQSGIDVDQDVNLVPVDVDGTPWRRSPSLRRRHGSRSRSSRTRNRRPSRSARWSPATPRRIRSSSGHRRSAGRHRRG